LDEVDNLDEWTESNLETLLSDDCDINARLDAAVSLSDSDDEGVANSLKEFVNAQNAPLDVLVEACATLALIWCRNDSFDPKFLIEMQEEACLVAIEEVFIPYRPEWVKLLPHHGMDWE